MRNALLSFVAVLALSGCALLGRSDPVVPRYYTPEYDGEPASTSVRSGTQLRLGRVEGWAHLRERMVARDSAREFFYSDARRWMERPEVYLRRALARTLFEERGLSESLSGRAITLEVELIAFEELEGPQRARFQARLVLRDDRIVLLAETVTLEQPVEKGAGADAGQSIAEAFSKALRAGVTRIADRVVAKLAERSVPAPG